MHPLLLPWPISGDVLTVLAYVLVVIAAGVFAWVQYTRGDDTPMGTYGMPALWFVGVLGAGIWVLKTQVGTIEAQPLPLHTYGLMIALGFISAIHLAGREAERSGWLKKEQLFDMAFYVLIFALIGSRVLFIIVNWSGPNGYGAHPERIFKVWTGGLVFYGGFIGATAAALWWARKVKVDFKALADITIPTVALGHFFGRMGCIAAGCCWGKVCDDPNFILGAEYPKGALAFGEMSRDPQWASFIVEHGHTPAVHPTQMYEAIGELLFFLVLTWFRPRKRFHGQVLAMWLMMYAVLRLTIEMFRGDFGRGMLLRIPQENPVLLSTSQIIGVLMFGLGLGLYLWWKPKDLPKLEGGTPAQAAAAA